MTWEKSVVVELLWDSVMHRTPADYMMDTDILNMCMEVFSVKTQKLVTYVKISKCLCRMTERSKGLIASEESFLLSMGDPKTQ